MTDTEALDLAPAAREVAGLLPGVREDQLGAPTPCPDYSVAELLAHLVDLAAAFRDAAAKRFGATTDTSPDARLPRLPADWREELPRRLTELAAAWRDPAAWRGETRAGGVSLPGAAAGGTALNELLLHGWDLARATGQPFAPDEASVRASLALLEGMAPEVRSAVYGPAVEVPADAPPFDRAVALSGRRPSWAPPPAGAGR